MNILSQLLLLAIVAGTQVLLTIGGCPALVTRSEWGASSPNRTTPIPDPVPYVIIHHSETPECETTNACKDRIRNIQDYHMNNRGWDDIGYNFLITTDGKIYEGRGWGTVGAHAPNYNSKSIGVCFIGSFSSKRPSNEALNAAENLISCGVSIGKIKTDYKLKGHRQVKATSCPGNSLYDIIKTWPNWAA